jgi:hypothetical protein
MKKLRLDLDQLTVDSFDTASHAEKKGTVFGEQCTCYTNCTCPGCPTCDNTACGQNTCYTCEWSCGGSCWYTECGGNTIDAHTCNPSRGIVQECCPY